jgi:hypothetical protein
MAEGEPVGKELFDGLIGLFEKIAEEAGEGEVSRLASTGEDMLEEFANALGAEIALLKKKLKYLVDVVLPKAATALQGNYKAHRELEDVTMEAAVTVESALEKMSA